MGVTVVFNFFSVELPENWTDTRETILEGMTFNLRHLGMTLVDEPKGEELSAAAVKRIVATVRTMRMCESNRFRLIFFFLNFIVGNTVAQQNLVIPVGYI